MKILLLLALSLAASAVDYETLTLSDGRTLDGWWDPSTNTLKLEHATLTIDPKDIVSEVKAKPPVAKSKVKMPGIAETASGENAGATTLSIRKRLEQIKEAKDKSDAKFEADYEQALRDWLQHGDFNQVAVRALGKDPKVSETTAHDRALKMNQDLDLMLQTQHRVAHDGKLSTSDLSAIQRFISSESFDDWTAQHGRKAAP